MLVIHCVVPENLHHYLHQNTQQSLKLTQYLARSSVETPIKANEIKRLCSLFAMPIAGGLAPLTGLADGLDALQHYWLRADPMQLAVNMTHFYKAEHPPSFVLREVRAIVQAVRKLLQDCSIALHTPTPNRWYLSMPFDPLFKGLSSGPLNQPIAIEDLQWGALLNTVNTKVSWKQLFNEIQMLLHAAHAPFNALWLWGGGKLPEPPLAHWQGIWSDPYPLLQGLAKWSGYPVQPLGLFSIEACVKTSPGKHLIALPDQIDKAKHYLEILMQAVKKNSIQSLRLLVIQGPIYCLTPYLIKRFWRRRLPL